MEVDNGGNGEYNSPSGPPTKKPRGDDGMTAYLERKDEKEPPNHIVLITVRDAKHPINVEVIYKVCSIVGPVAKIVCFERTSVTQVHCTLHPTTGHAEMLSTWQPG